METHDADDSGGASVERLRLPLTSMAKGDSFTRRQVAKFRQQLEGAVTAVTEGTITLPQASRIHSACIGLRRWLQVEKRLARDGATLPLTDWLALCDRSLRYKAEVDRHIQALALSSEAKAADPWDWLAAEQRKQLAAPDRPRAPQAASRPDGPVDAESPAGAIPGGPEAVPATATTMTPME